MTWFIDRRLNGKNKSTVNRQRFLRRYKAQIKQSISEAINKRSVTDVDSGESVSIPTDDISEPMFHQGRGGRGITLMGNQPQLVAGLLVGTVLGVALFRGVPVGPLIAAGLVSLIVGKQ